MDDYDFVKEQVKKNNNRMRLKDLLQKLQKFRQCSREPAFRKLRYIVNEGWGCLVWERESPRKVYVVYRPECDHEVESQRV